MGPQLTAIYTSSNCEFAYQLRWGVTLFWLEPPGRTEWNAELISILETKDQIRILDYRWASPKSLQLSASTRPESSPVFAIQRIKGRLVYLLDANDRKLLEPTYAIRSYGTQNREVIESYIASQWQRHPMATAQMNEWFSELSFHDPANDLSKKQATKQGVYWYNLHVVLVHVERWRDVKRERLKSVMAMVRSLARKNDWRLSTCSILADHLHLAIGCTISDRPMDVALSLLNNLAFVYEMKAVFDFGAFIGTFGEYDQRSVRGLVR